MKFQVIPKKKIKQFQDKLLEWFELNKRKYPWRKSKLSNYNYIIAEILLQRTKADTVSKFYNSFLNVYPNWNSINDSNIRKLEKDLTPIGLYKQRAKRLKQLAEYMVLSKGKLPKKRNELEKIPFIGQYIANAIEVFIFKKSAPLLDVNMSRVLERYFGKRKLADIRFDPYLQKLAHEYVDHPKTIELNWAILDFAALICKSKPSCDLCHLIKKCNYYKITKYN